MTTFRKEQKWPFDPTPGVVGVRNDSTLAFMVFCAQFPLIWYATWLLSVKDIVWPLTPPLGQGCVCGQNICYHVAASVVSFYLICNMTTVRKIYSLTFWPRPLGRGCVCGQNICYHVAASVVSFNLICNMTIFWKSLILASAPPPKFTKGARNQAFKLKSRFICFISIAALPACNISAKIFIIALVIAKFKYLTFDPLGGVKGGGVKLWHCHSYLQALGNHAL